ncbi:LemA family protein [Planctomycetales bacterium ZRK34]|nr:LemA family protein [Planctomycetales bacterium ZRK34]
MVGWIVLGVVAAVLIISLISIYNGLVAKRVQCENAWSQIDVQLKRRHDLIPNLVETVKGYAKHERETLDAVIQARSQAVSATGVEDQAQAEGLLTAALGKLFALSEAYPDLKANTNFIQLQEELTSTENKIGFARQHYNDTVSRYNTAVQSFPANIIAGMFSFKEREFFEIEDPKEKEVPQVSF